MCVCVCVCVCSSHLLFRPKVLLLDVENSNAPVRPPASDGVGSSGLVVVQDGAGGSLVGVQSFLSAELRVVTVAYLGLQGEGTEVPHVQIAQGRDDDEGILVGWRLGG